METFYLEKQFFNRIDFMKTTSALNDFLSSKSIYLKTSNQISYDLETYRYERIFYAIWNGVANRIEFFETLYITSKRVTAARDSYIGGSISA